MTSLKRALKGAPDRTVAERDDRKARIGALIKLLSEEDSGFNPRLFKQAMDWSERNFRAYQVKKKPFPFPDPLSVAEYMASKKPDSTTINAALLFSFVSPTNEKDFSRKELTSITKTFGEKTAFILEHSIQLDAFDLLPLLPGAGQSEKEQKSEFMRGIMLVAEIPEVVFLRGSYRRTGLVEMYKAAKDHAVSRQKIALEAQDIRDFLAPVSYRVDYEFLRYDLLDAAFQAEEPERYRRIKAEISGDITQEDIQDVQDQLSKFITKIAVELGIDPKYLSAEIREKSPDSTDTKAKRKKQETYQLGDLQGFQASIDANLYLQDQDFNDLTKKQQGEVIARLGDLDHKVYECFSQEFGRANLDPSWVDQFKRLALIDPHPDIPGTDARFDDYVSQPKDAGELEPGVQPVIDLGFGYSSLQDTFFIRTKSGKMVAMEGQIFDSLRGKNNKYHPNIGHVAYKTGLPMDAFMINWFANAKAIQEGRAGRPGQTVVYTENNELVLLPTAATIKDYAKVMLHRTASPENSQPVPGNLQARLDNDDPTARRVPGVLYGQDTKLINGDRVSLQTGPGN